jgi:predicted 2-oxoglutarate/Fe(II)-dependent dioxygenase YbiX
MITEQGPSVAQVGDRAPPCCGMTTDQRFYSFEEQFGRSAVLILAGTGAVAKISSLVQEFAAFLPAFAARKTDVLLLVDDDPRALWPIDLASVPLRVVDCGNFLSLCKVRPADALILVLDRNLRVALRMVPNGSTPPGPSLTRQPSIASMCLACLDELPFEEPRDICTPAPAIILPNLLARSLCRILIDRFETSAAADGEVARIDADGAVRSVIDHAKKHRRDLLIPPDDALHPLLAAALLGRCAPEIAKAFQANVAYIDRILIARYDETGGWFRRHRDDAAENVAFRQFAISVNLNAEEYQGGHLLFPEYNDHRYRPPTGGGVIFSTSVLHEAAAVISGRRYVLLTFFHSEANERRRLAYLTRMGPRD